MATEFPPSLEWEGMLEDLADGTKEYLPGATPPARRELLAALNQLVTAATTMPYAVTLSGCDPSDCIGSGGTTDVAYWAQVAGPGTRALKPWVTRSRHSTSSTAASDTTIVDATNSINIPPPWELAETDDPWPMGFLDAIVGGSEEYDASPGSQDNRLIIVNEQMSPQIETYSGDKFNCVGGEWRRSDDLSAI